MLHPAGGKSPCDGHVVVFFSVRTDSIGVISFCWGWKTAGFCLSSWVSGEVLVAWSIVLICWWFFFNLRRVFILLLGEMNVKVKAACRCSQSLPSAGSRCACVRASQSEVHNLEELTAKTIHICLCVTPPDSSYDTRTLRAGRVAVSVLAHSTVRVSVNRSLVVRRRE